MKLFPQHFTLMQKLFGEKYLGLVLLIILIVSVVTCSGQTTVSYQLTSRDNVGITSPKQDTLYLLDEPIGYQIKKSWYLKDSKGRDLYPVRPFFVFLPRDKFARKLENQIVLETRKTKTNEKN